MELHTVWKGETESARRPLQLHKKKESELTNFLQRKQRDSGNVSFEDFRCKEGVLSFHLRQACSSQYLSNSTKITTNTETAMLSNMYIYVIHVKVTLGMWLKSASQVEGWLGEKMLQQIIRPWMYLLDLYFAKVMQKYFPRLWLYRKYSLPYSLWTFKTSRQWPVKQ